jgi:hypothetical protein
MDKQLFGKIMKRHALYWGWAIITPTIVMVVLDGFDKHTPNNIALFSTFFVMIPFIFCNGYLSKQLASLIPREDDISSEDKA